MFYIPSIALWCHPWSERRKDKCASSCAGISEPIFLRNVQWYVSILYCSVDSKSYTKPKSIHIIFIAKTHITHAPCKFKHRQITFGVRICVCVYVWMLVVYTIIKTILDISGVTCLMRSMSLHHHHHSRVLFCYAESRY